MSIMYLPDPSFTEEYGLGVAEKYPYSLFTLLDDLYRHKRLYYKGKSEITDIEYDNLEMSIKEIHGETLFYKYVHTGYDANVHKEITERAKYYKEKFSKEYNGVK